MYLGDKFDKLDKKDKKMWRKRSIWAVYSSDIIDDNRAKTVNGEIPNTVLTVEIKEFIVV